MTSLILIFGSSFILVLFMIANRMRHMEQGRAFISFNYTRVDKKLDKYISISKVIATELPKHFGRETFHFFIRGMVSLARKVRKMIYPKIAHIVDTVKGREIPRNRGSVSFYLVSLGKKEERK